MAASNRIKAEMYILFKCNAWYEYSSFEPKAVFSFIKDTNIQQYFGKNLPR